MASIVRDDDIRSGAPRIAGTRVTVLDIKHRVIDDGEDPHVVVDEYELSKADLFRALAYYYDNRETLESRERADATRRQEGEQRTRERARASAGRIVRRPAPARIACAPGRFGAV